MEIIEKVLFDLSDTEDKFYFYDSVIRDFINERPRIPVYDNICGESIKISSSEAPLEKKVGFLINLRTDKRKNSVRCDFYIEDEEFINKMKRLFSEFRMIPAFRSLGFICGDNEDYIVQEILELEAYISGAEFKSRQQAWW
ncbi:MAG: hypothetical protein KQH63_04395 [Desulfobulbaceae bacterium]|nr:hypothetical protein [Desulfobulbaceae bacterium]